MAWKMTAEQTVVVGINADELFAVVGPGTPESRHIQQTKFDGITIPHEILTLIPKRL